MSGEKERAIKEDDRKIHVMEVLHSLEIGGMERVVSHLAQHLDPEAFSCSVCCLTRKGAFSKPLEDKGIQVLCLEKKPGVSPLLPRVLAGHLRRMKTDLIHAHNSGPLFTGTLAGLLARTPAVVYTDHARNYPDRWRVMATERALVRMVDAVVSVSNENRENLIRHLWVPEKKIRVIPNGVAAPQVSGPEVLARKRRELGIAPDQKVVVSVSRLEAQKAVHFQIEAASILADRIKDVRFLVVGEGSERPELEALIRERGLEGRFILAGWRTDAPDLVAASDVFVLSSNWEGLPMSLLEAMALGKPAVCTAVGDVPEVLLEGETGLLIPPGDPGALAEALARILSEPELAGRMAAGARSRFEGGYGVRNMVGAYENLFRELLCQKKASR